MHHYKSSIKFQYTHFRRVKVRKSLNELKVHSVIFVFLILVLKFSLLSAIVEMFANIRDLNYLLVCVVLKMSLMLIKAAII